MPFDFYVERTESCWVWRGGINGRGYGQYRFQGRDQPAHRVAYMLAHSLSELPSTYGPHGMVVMHKCDNRRCVNPQHLFLGTRKNNTHDAILKGRMLHATYGEPHVNRRVTDHGRVWDLHVAGCKVLHISQWLGISRANIDRILGKRLLPPAKLDAGYTCTRQ